MAKLKEKSIAVLKTIRFGGLRLSKNYAIDWSFLRKIRNFSDGISFFEFNCNLDLYKSDHNPKINIHLMLINIMIFEFEIYNVNHVEEQNDLVD